MTAKVSPIYLENAINDYVAGEGAEVCAIRWHTTWDTLTAELKRRGLLRTKQGRYELMAQKARDRSVANEALPIDEIVSRYLAGESENALATAFQTVRTVIRLRLIRAGVTIRGYTAANRLMQTQRTPEQRKQYIQAAHDAQRGAKRPIKALINQALSKEARQSHISDSERLLVRWLTERGLDPIPQKAIGTYNCDIAAGAVAVEIFGGNWHAYGNHIARLSKRCDYILNQGWSLLIIWCNKNGGSITMSAADYVDSYLEETRRDPSLIGKYRMIWGNGQVIPADSHYVENRAVIKALGDGPNRRG